MASITIDNLQPMVEYQELSDAELESVIGGGVFGLALGALGIAGAGASIGGLVLSAMAMAR